MGREGGPKFDEIFFEGAIKYAIKLLVNFQLIQTRAKYAATFINGQVSVKANLLSRKMVSAFLPMRLNFLLPKSPQNAGTS
jgi:hypothetical protein